MTSENDGDSTDPWQNKAGSIAALPVGTRAIRVTMIADIVNSNGTDYVQFDGIDISLSLVDIGTETIEITPASGTSIYDQGGNALSATQTTCIKSLNDKAAPTITSFSPSDDARDISRNTNLEMTFNENVITGTGNIVLKKTFDNSIIESIDVTDDSVSGSGTNTITIDPSVPLDTSTGFYVLVDATAFDDSAGNSFAGIAATTDWNFETAPLSTNANLNALTLSSGALSPIFNSGTINYTANVSNSVSNFTMTPTTTENIMRK